LPTAIILPIFNEEKILLELIDLIARTMHDKIYRILAVDDGSTDQSTDILRELSKKYPIEITHFGENRGIRAVFFEGLRRVLTWKDFNDNDPIFIMESDGTSDPNLLVPMIDRIEKGAAVVIASRMTAGGKYEGFPPYRRWLSVIGNALLALRYQEYSVKDFTIFFRCYRRSVVEKLLSLVREEDFESSGFAVNVEILLMILQFTSDVEEIPHVYKYSLKQSKSKNSLLVSFIQTFSLLMKDPGKLIRKRLLSLSSPK